VLLDLAAYRALLLADVPVDWAKAAGFIAGTLFAYFANRLFTFQAQGGGRVFAAFLGLYAITLCCNVAVNHAALLILPRGEVPLAIAFVLATAVSATLNFIGMRFAVFTRANGSGPP